MGTYAFILLFAATASIVVAIPVEDETTTSKPEMESTMTTVTPGMRSTRPFFVKERVQTREAETTPPPVDLHRELRIFQGDLPQVEPQNTRLPHFQPSEPDMMRAFPHMQRFDPHSVPYIQPFIPFLDERMFNPRPVPGTEENAKKPDESSITTTTKPTEATAQDATSGKPMKEDDKPEEIEGFTMHREHQMPPEFPMLGIYKPPIHHFPDYYPMDMPHGFPPQMPPEFLSHMPPHFPMQMPQEKPEQMSQEEEKPAEGQKQMQDEGKPVEDQKQMQEENKPEERQDQVSETEQERQDQVSETEPEGQEQMQLEDGQQYGEGMQQQEFQFGEGVQQGEGPQFGEGMQMQLRGQQFGEAMQMQQRGQQFGEGMQMQQRGPQFGEGMQMQQRGPQFGEGMQMQEQPSPQEEAKPQMPRLQMPQEEEEDERTEEMPARMPFEQPPMFNRREEGEFPQEQRSGNDEMKEDGPKDERVLQMRPPYEGRILGIVSQMPPFRFGGQQDGRVFNMERPHDGRILGVISNRPRFNVQEQSPEDVRMNQVENQGDMWQGNSYYQQPE